MGGEAKAIADDASALERVFCLKAQLAAMEEKAGERFATWLASMREHFGPISAALDAIKQAKIVCTTAAVKEKTERLRPLCKGGFDGTDWKANLSKTCTWEALATSGEALLQPKLAKEMNLAVRDLSEDLSIACGCPSKRTSARVTCLEGSGQLFHVWHLTLFWLCASVWSVAKPSPSMKAQQASFFRLSLSLNRTFAFPFLAGGEIGHQHGRAHRCFSRHGHSSCKDGAWPCGRDKSRSDNTCCIDKQEAISSWRCQPWMRRQRCGVRT